MKLLYLILFIVFFYSCQSDRKNEIVQYGDGVQIIGRTVHHWTDVAVSEKGDIFACFPRNINENSFYSIAKIENEKMLPFPDNHWNNWNFKYRNDKDRFINITDIIIGKDGFLWALDASFYNDSVIRPPVLYKINIDDKRIDKKFIMHLHTKSSFLCCMDIDFENNFAYISDTGEGSLIVIDLNNGKSWSRLKGHSSFNMLSDYKDSSYVNNFNSIGLSYDRRFLFYTSLSNSSIYKVSAVALRNRDVLDYEMDFFLTYIGKRYYTHDLMFYNQKDYLIGDIEDRTLKLVCREEGVKKLLKIKSPELPGYFTRDTAGYVYLTTVLDNCENNDGKVSLLKLKPGCYKE